MKPRFIRRILTFTAVSSMFILLVSCGSEPNTLFDMAAPEHSVMQIYVNEGDGTDVYRLSDDALEREVLEQLKNTTATPVQVTTADVKFPMYSFWMGTTDGWGLEMTLSNEYLWNRDGAVYAFDFNFKKLLDTYPFVLDDHWDDRYLPCEWYLVQDGNGWNAALMEKAEEPVPPVGITLTMEREDDRFHATFTNTTSAEWSFGKSYSLQVKLGEDWYHVPVSPENNWAFVSIGLVVPAGDDWNEDYSLDMYGDLPAGQYRFYIYGLTWEFDTE